MRGTTVNYEEILPEGGQARYDVRVAHLEQVLPPAWQKSYRKMTQAPTRIHRFSYRGYSMLFDRPSELVTARIIPPERAPEDRIVVVYGRSGAGGAQLAASPGTGLLGKEGPRFGEPPARSYLPGSVLAEPLDISLYPLYRDLDHERTPDGRTYRAMQQHCRQEPGTFCFSRLIYTSRSWAPTLIEHGLLRQDATFWIHQWYNAPPERRLRSMVRSGRSLIAQIPFRSLTFPRGV